MNAVNVLPLSDLHINSIADYWDDLSNADLLKMGALRSNIPSREQFIRGITHQLSLPDEEKKAFAIIAFLNNEAIGHCNLNPVLFGQEGKMHLHIWNSTTRSKGLGQQMVEQALPIFFDRFQLKRIIVEPYADNKGPNRVLEKVGFRFVKRYTTLPSPHCFEQEVLRWEMNKPLSKN